MNQILFSEDIGSENSAKQSLIKNKKFHFLKFQFVLCLCVCTIISGYYLYLQYDKSKQEALSNEIINRFSITQLYENNESNYSTSRLLNENNYQTDDFSFSVIGLIEITSIGVYYPIINEFNDQLLKIAPCKFYGVNPNEIR